MTLFCMYELVQKDEEKMTNFPYDIASLRSLVYSPLRILDLL